MVIAWLSGVFSRSAGKVEVSVSEQAAGSVTFEPIGVVRSPFVERSEAPRQPSLASDVEGRVELFSGRGFEDAVCDLALWDHVWLIVWFHHNTGFRPKVQPPRSAVKRGLFATRSPYRPNPIGISAVKLVRVEELTLFVRGMDLLDGTPVLDVKPYVPYSDAIPDAGHGWLDPGEPVGPRPVDPGPAYEVAASEHAQVQLAYLASEHGLELWPRIRDALSLGPSPHAYRRIRKDEGGYTLAVKDWRVRFTVSGRRVEVDAIASGYKPRELWGAAAKAPEAHRQFVLRWP